jgi:hypothetical protein
MTAHLVVFLVICISISPLIYLWVKGIDYMHRNHPDYKGDDFLNWGEDDENENDKHQIM